MSWSSGADEYTAPEDLEAGANVLMQVVLALTESREIPESLKAATSFGAS